MKKRNGKKLKKKFKILIDTATKKGKVLTRIFRELKKKSWTCAKCEELLQIIYNPQLARTTKKGDLRKTSRRAYMNGRKKPNTRAKRAMRLHHTEGISLREAWRRV